MAKLYYRYGAMGSSKTANALMVKYNYEERGQKVLLTKPGIDTRDGVNKIVSRCGLESECVLFEDINELQIKDYDCIIVDEAQFLNKEQAKLLAQNGLVRFHHNINTCKSYHPQICTTHTYEDRINTVKLVQKYGIELCCGVIIGMGETIEQRIEMAMELAEINPESIPVNILTPIPNTPFESYIDKIDEENVLRTLAVFKIACPNSSIRLAGGKKSRLSLESIEKAFSHCVDSTIVGNYLTTTGFTPSEDVKLIQKIGRKITNLQLV